MQGVMTEAFSLWCMPQYCIGITISLFLAAPWSCSLDVTFKQPTQLLRHGFRQRGAVYLRCHIQGSRVSQRSASVDCCVAPSLPIKSIFCSTLPIHHALYVDPHPPALAFSRLTTSLPHRCLVLAHANPISIYSYPPEVIPSHLCMNPTVMLSCVRVSGWGDIIVFRMPLARLLSLHSRSPRGFPISQRQTRRRKHVHTCIISGMLPSRELSAAAAMGNDNGDADADADGEARVREGEGWVNYLQLRRLGIASLSGK